jgi:hypothetical protein
LINLFHGDKNIPGMKRTTYGEMKYESRVNILGVRILLGYYERRSDAMLAEDVAGKIRKALTMKPAHKFVLQTTGSGKSS